MSQLISKRITAVFAAAAAAMLAAAAPESSSAYFTDGDTAANRFSIGSNTISVQEDFDPPGEVKPGDVIVKKAAVTNEGTVDCYTRVLAVFIDGKRVFAPAPAEA